MELRLLNDGDDGGYNGVAFVELFKIFLLENAFSTTLVVQMTQITWEISGILVSKPELSALLL